MKVVFIDRDGVINKDRSDYVKNWAEFSFIPGSLEALRVLTENGYTVIIITNQSVINRNMVQKEELEEMLKKMEAAVASHGGRIEAVFYCPHVPEDRCDCRKPKPGLFHQARDLYSLEPASTTMIGDSFKDIEAARAAGCGKAILVRTGHGKETERLCREKGVKPDHIADNLLHAVQWLIALSHPKK